MGEASGDLWDEAAGTRKAAHVDGVRLQLGVVPNSPRVSCQDLSGGAGNLHAIRQRAVASCIRAAPFVCEFNAKCSSSFALLSSGTVLG